MPFGLGSQHFSKGVGSDSTGFSSWLQQFGDTTGRSTMCFHCDNKGIISVLRSNSSKHPLMAYLLRCSFFYAAYFKISHSFQHSWAQNTSADTLSQGNMSQFFFLFLQGQQSDPRPSVSVCAHAQHQLKVGLLQQCCHSLMTVLHPPLMPPTLQASVTT